MDKKIKIVSILQDFYEDYNFLDQVIALGDSQRKLLGFLPAGAFEDYAEKGWIHVAITPDNVVVGYAAYRLTCDYCSITHICVSPSYRKSKIGVRLVQSVKKIAKGLRKIKLKCRRDYGLEKFWNKNGFVPVNETKGRNLEGKPLTIWEYSIQPSLLTYSSNNKPLIVLDLNIIIAAHFENSPECSALFTEFVSDDVDYRVSQYSFNEANTQQESIKRNEIISTLKSYSLVGVNENNDILDALTEIVGINHFEDIQQLASAIYSGADCFVTLDKKIRAKSSEIFKQFSMNIYTPAEFLINITESISKNRYSPKFVSTGDISFAAFTSFDESELWDKYHNASENKSNFRSVLTKFVTHNDSNGYIFKIIAEGKDLGLCVQRQLNDIIYIEMLRLAKNVFNKYTIANHIVETIIKNALNSGADMILYNENNYAREIESVLHESGFLFAEGKFIKILGKGILHKEQALELYNKTISSLTSKKYDEIPLANLEENMVHPDEAYF